MKHRCNYTRLEPIEKVIPNPRNPNKHPDGQIELLAKILDFQGWRSPIVVSKSSGFIVRGHGRLLAAQRLGLKKVPVDLQDYESEAQEWADLVADNRIAELAELDRGSLKDLIEELDTGELDLDVTGFDQGSLEDLMSEFFVPEDGETDADEIPDDVQTRTKPGDLWTLGDHRIICGDSTDPDCLDRLVPVDGVDCLFSSPPYNVDVVYSSHDDAHATAEKYMGFLKGVCDVIVPKIKTGRAFVWNIGVSPRTFPFHHVPMLESMGLEFVRQFVWQKTGVPVPCFYHTRDKKLTRFLSSNYTHEMVYVLSKGDLEIGDRTTFDDTLENDVFSISQSMATRDLPPGRTKTGTAQTGLTTRPHKAHPAAFPVKLPSSFLSHYTSEGEIVIDPFLGSGTTLIAAQRLERICYGIEIDPHYCDVVIQRWEEFTGKKATKAKR